MVQRTTDRTTDRTAGRTTQCPSDHSSDRSPSPSPSASSPRLRPVRALAPALVATLAATLLAAPAAFTPATRDPAGGGPGTGAHGAGAPATGADTAGVPPAGPPADASVPYRHFLGRAFDTCEAPTLASMRAWRASPYRAVGVYFGGRGRGCLVQKNLNADWITSVENLGWRVLPLFVGSQAPCVFAEHKKDVPIGDNPWQQGTQEADDAVRAARALGIAPSSPLYLDMEAYRISDLQCAATTLLFIRAWNREVRRQGYLPGFYSSADTGVRHLEEARKADVEDLPSVIWFARWRGTPALYEEPVLHPEAWPERSRIHQYAGNVRETYGGHSLQIDRSAVDAPVAHIADARP
ncbi:DUF1906 domain-containing protein [Streptomyces sp. ISL-36]|nr:DUF1906 domain-containing protein [Streptomyces sp. ISL-36]